MATITETFIHPERYRKPWFATYDIADVAYDDLDAVLKSRIDALEAQTYPEVVNTFLSASYTLPTTGRSTGVLYNYKNDSSGNITLTGTIDSFSSFELEPDETLTLAWNGSAYKII